MLLVDKIASEARVIMSESEGHMKEKLKLGIDIRKHRELAEAAEATASERIREMYLQRTRDEYISGLQQALKAKEEELDARDKLLQEKWTLEDEELRVQRALREAHARGQVEDEILIKLHEEMASRLQKLHLARESKIIEVERTRSIRVAKEHAQEGYIIIIIIILIITNHYSSYYYYQLLHLLNDLYLTYINMNMLLFVNKRSL